MLSKAQQLPLSRRERQIMHLLLEGIPNKDIAEQLHVSERTVKFHCGNIYKKLNIENRYELIKILSQKTVPGYR